MPKTKTTSANAQPDDAAIAAACAKEHVAYLAWARRVIDAERWNWDCPSRRCRRNGCQGASRCEPVLCHMLGFFRLKLSHALLEENSIRRAVDEDYEAWDRRMTLADARARGLLPPQEEEPV